jgi:hypothetical protein
MSDRYDGRFDSFGLETPFSAEAETWETAAYEDEHENAFPNESDFAYEGDREGEELAWLGTEAAQSECPNCGSSAHRETDFFDESKGLDEAVEGEDEALGLAGACVARMKFEFQTKNKLHRNDGKTTSQLKRKYGPVDFLFKEDGARLESESDTNGVVEFETEWFRKWSNLETAVQSAVTMTQAMSAASPARYDTSRLAFPFDVAHLRKATAAERKQGYWNPTPGKEGKGEKPLGATEDIEVQILDPDWTAGIQSSEGIFLEHFESLLEQQEDPSLAIETNNHTEALMKIVSSGSFSATNAKIRNFLLLITNYIMHGQRDPVKGNPSKFAFTLMSRTKFSSIYSNLLSQAEQKKFSSLVAKKSILKQLGLTTSTRFFKEGYGEKSHDVGPTVDDWLQGITGGKDLLAAGQSPGLSAAMGRYPVETSAGQKDRWLVKFEARRSFMKLSPFQKAKDWVTYAEALFKLACKREANSVELLIKQGISDEAALTYFVLHARHPELRGRKVRKSETILIKEFEDIRSSIIQPLLPESQPEAPAYGFGYEARAADEDESAFYTPEWGVPSLREGPLTNETGTLWRNQTQTECSACQMSHSDQEDGEHEQEFASDFSYELDFAPTTTVEFEDEFDALLEAVQALDEVPALTRPAILRSGVGSDCARRSASNSGQALSEPKPRPCCVLRPTIIGLDQALEIKDAAPHFYGEMRYPQDEKSGFVYTLRGGFVDLGHSRDWLDWTGYLAVHAKALLQAGGDLELTCEQNTFRTISFVKQNEPRSDEVCVYLAQRIAYELAIWHEIETSIGNQQTGSAFSPEDNFSNLLGTYMGRDALLKFGFKPFNDAAALAIQLWLNKLGAVSKARTVRAFDLVKDKWWNSGSSPINGFDDLLLKRNFDALNQVTPMLVPGLRPGSGPLALPVPTIVKTPQSPGELVRTDLRRLYRLELGVNSTMKARLAGTNLAGRNHVTPADFKDLIDLSKRVLTP